MSLLKARKMVTTVSKIADSNSVATVQNLAKLNPYSTVTRNSPNADKLADGAIQRAAVQPGCHELAYKVNTDKVGLMMRPHQGVSSSGSAHFTTDPFLDA